jgi:hypothetical protein
MVEPLMKAQLVRMEDVYFRRYMGLYGYLTPVSRCSNRLTYIRVCDPPDTDCNSIRSISNLAIDFRLSTGSDLVAQEAFSS